MKNLRTIQFFTVFICLLVIACSNDDDSITLSSSNKVDIGDYNLFVETKGNGNNTIVFESGLGDNYESWYKITELSETNQVIKYNRAGYEPSEAANNNRNIVQLAEELHQVILSKSINEKVILVGHSLGGAIIRYYAVQHPERVKALLFIDPSHEDFAVMTQNQEDDMVDYFTGEDLLHVANEAGQFVENFEVLGALPPLPDVPTIVLTSIRDREGSNETRWVSAHTNLGENVTSFTHITTENSGHYIQVEEPGLVLGAIHDLLN